MRKISVGFIPENKHKRSTKSVHLKQKQQKYGWKISEDQIKHIESDIVKLNI